jgi:hypothetical protein
MNQWPADKVERRKVSDLVPYARNSRTHSPEQVGQIAASIKEWGWTVPVLIDPDGGLIAGHGRIMAAQKLGIDNVPCMVAEGWTDAMLKVELGELGDLDFDLTLTGFGLEEMAQLFDEPDFAPGTEDDQGKLDQLAPKLVTCPHCAAEWDLREHGQG